jgi:hypothetical protein
MLCPDEPEVLIQRYIAVLMYFSFNGPEWSNCDADLTGETSLQPCVGGGTRWLDSSHECEWFGISCESTTIDTYNSYPITKINLTANNLAGFIPVEMFELTELTGLSMDHNKNIYGEIPSEIGWLYNLKYIDLDDNYLQGSIPDVIYSMTALQAIDLNANRLTGTISSDIGNLVNLMVLQLEDNVLQGPIPGAALANLDKLLLVTLHGNYMTGSLEDVCSEVDDRRVENPGYLQFFMSDCLDDDADDFISCSCCSRCF